MDKLKHNKNTEKNIQMYIT